MYITYNGKNYPCVCRPNATMRYFGLPEDFPAPIDGKIVLCSNDGFILRTDTAEDYLRQTFVNGVLTLTNVPEPITPTEPEEEEISEPSELEQLRADVDYIAIMTGVTL